MKCTSQIGAPFDYNVHNAIMREQGTEYEEDTVCKVSQAGRDRIANALPACRFLLRAVLTYSLRDNPTNST